ncbi:MAG: ABC transporter ATP-binding protein, partial [Hyphomicrobiales bacterium]
TYVLRGDGVDTAAKALAGMAGIDQIAPFGTTVHVVGQDRQALIASVGEVVRETGILAREGQTSLEDVFIQFMGQSTDNMA